MEERAKGSGISPRKVRKNCGSTPQLAWLEQQHKPINQQTDTLSQHEEIESSFYYQECKFPASLRLELEKLSLFR
ncbi:hypothetical protein NC652_023305 [Populus alba x Populus x berolinensis]|nr:hypothetical protein NC652_023305 [Populus alba x Populus x berolinensis]